MMYAIALSGMIIGFTLGVLTIARVTVRPEIRKVLLKYKVLKGHKARRPRRQFDVDTDLDLL